MFIVVVNDFDKCVDLFEVWDIVGVKGVICIDIIGIGYMCCAVEVGDLFFYFSLVDLFRVREYYYWIFFIVVDDEFLLEKLIGVVQDVIGGFDVFNIGILFIVLVNNVYGVVWWLL